MGQTSSNNNNTTRNTTNQASRRQQRLADHTVSESVFDVITSGDKTQLEFILGALRDFNINAQGPAGNPPLHHAVHGTVNTIEMIRVLVKRGAFINALSADGETPLVAAVVADREDVVRILLELGADVDCPARNGAVPLYWALVKRCSTVLPLLLAKKPNVNFLTEDTESILHAAVRFGDATIVDAILNGLQIYPGGKVLLPPLAHRDRRSNNNKEDGDDSSGGGGGGGGAGAAAGAEEPVQWTQTVSLLDARSSSAGSTPLGIAIHSALNSSNSVAVRSKATEVAHLLSAVRTEQLLDDHLGVPRVNKK